MFPDNLNAPTQQLQQLTLLTGFEGPEKKLEIDFTFTEYSNKLGFLKVTKNEWSEMLKYAKCEIVGHTSNEYFNSYVLSESSLFVYPTKILIKTCGTTTLLRIIEPLLEIANSLKLEKSFISYSRKNFNFPQLQKAPHSSFDEEVSYLNRYFDGYGFLIGNEEDKDYWNMYIADYKDEKHTLSNVPEVNLELCMSELSPEKMKQFFKKDDVNAKETTKKSGISDLLKDSIIDEFQFDPCGYSMNGLKDEFYSTIHITPEDHCSYVSYETNITKKALADLGKTYQDLINDVIQCFGPKRFTVTLHADDHALTEEKTIGEIKNIEKYKMDKNFYEFEQGYNLTFATFHQ